MRRLISLFIAFVVIALAGCGAAFFYLFVAFSQSGPLDEEKTVLIPKGKGIAAIAEILHQEKIVDSAFIFHAGVRLWSEGAPLQAGEYTFPPRISAQSAMKLLIEGKSILHKLTIAEGLTIAEAYAAIKDAPLLEGDLPAPLPEGSLLPETYSYLRGEDRTELVDRMRIAMEKALDDLWQERDPGIVLSDKTQVLILASIVEKETSLAAERPHIAAVFYNRLKQGIKLQSDPTVIYALTKGAGKLGRALTRDDLKIDDPYNTYVIDGLPPGPIANAGSASIEAVLHPASSEDLYFVADGTGGHAFARTLEEHNKNVAKWRRSQSQQTSH